MVRKGPKAETRREASQPGGGTEERPAVEGWADCAEEMSPVLTVGCEMRVSGPRGKEFRANLLQNPGVHRLGMN